MGVGIAPDVVLAGAPKCGTTTMYHHLASFPDVAVSDPKEPRFLTQVVGAIDGGDPTGPPRSGNHHLGEQWYASCFADASEGALRCDATTIYFHTEDTPGLLLERRPDARIVLMLRDPIDRTVSHYHQERRFEALPDLEEMIRSDHPRMHHYLGVSRYAEHVARWVNTFGDAVLVITLEELTSRPRDVVTEVARHLGIDLTGWSGPAEIVSNHRRASRSPRLQRVLATVNGGGRLDVLPEGARRGLRRAARAARRMNETGVRTDPADVAREYELVRAAFGPELIASAGAVDDLLGRRLTGAWV